LFDATPQFDCHQRIHAEVEEPHVLADLRGIDARHLCYRVAQVIRQKLLALLHRSIGEPLDQLGLPRRRYGRRRVGHLALQLRQECPPPRLLVERQETGPVDPGHNALYCPVRGRSRHDIGQTARASAGDKVRTPRLSSRARDSASAMPADQGPKLTLIPEMPCSRRRQASPSRNALAAP